ncbi:extracellular solute-binding protein [Ruegeria sp. SCPT10]|uniref:extracellular solute-binding protein n=1 Tax=Ruegeria sp. SCP10 TaxID=3141377 RepID=UPI00333C6450
MKKTIASSLAAGLLAAMALPSLADGIRVDGFPPFDTHFDKQVNVFNEAHPDIAVTYQMNEHGDHHKKLTTNLATQSGAGDVVIVDVSFVGAFINAGGFVNLSDAPYNAGQFKDGFVSYAWNQGQGSDGNQYGIPIDIGPGVMFYRRDVLESVGAEIDGVISDWNSYIEYGRKLKDKGVYLIADAGDVARIIVRTTLQEGEGLFFDADGNSLVTSDRFDNAFTIAKQIRDEGLDGQIGAWTGEWYDGFKNGTVATQLSGAWLLGHLQNWMAPDTAGKWGASNLPGGIYGSWGGSFLAIPAQSENPAQAWEFIKYLTTQPDPQIDSLKDLGAFPVLLETYGDAAFDEPLDFLAGQKARRLFADVAKKVPAVTPMKGDLIAEDIVMNGALAEVLNDGKDIEQALKDADRLLKRRIK